ncbi:hypothetical protein A1D31_22345 [Bradyrhizobium liaoningense]|nr:hypothetical protein A1D31_22345 [Bradyrhizobium liaoningense]
MPTEQEELRLTVTLADNASSGLAKLNEEIKQLGSGAGQQSIEKFKRETTEITDRVKGMGREVGEANKGLGMLRSGLALGSAGLALFGAEILRQTKIVLDYADKIRTLNQQARAIGVNPAQLKNIQDQLAAFGVSGETAARGLASVSEKMSDLQRRGSQVAQELRKNAGSDPESIRNMDAYINRLRNAKDITEQINIIREGGEQVYQNAIRAGASTQEAANRRTRFQQMQGYDAALAHAGAIKELNAEEQARADERLKRAGDLSLQLGQIKKKWEDIVETSNQPMLQNLKAVFEFIDPILDKLKIFQEWQAKDTSLPPVGTPLEKIDRPESEKGWLERFGDYWRGPEKSMDELRKSMDEQRKVLQEMNDRIKGGPGSFQPTGFSGGGMGGGIIPATYSPGGGGPFGPSGGGGGGGFRSGSGFSLMPNGQTAGPGSGAGAGSTPAAGGGGGGAPGVGAARGRVAEGGDPRGMESYIRQQAAANGIDPDTAVAVAKSEGLASFQSTARTKGGAREESWGAFQLYTGGGLGNEFQKQTGLDPRDPKNEKATIDFALKHASQKGWGAFHGAKNTGIGRWAGIGGGNGQTAGAGTGAGAGGSMAGGSVPKPVMDEAKALLIRGGGSGELQQFMASKGYPRSGAWCGQFTASVVTEAGGKPPRNAAVASNWLTWGEHVDPADVREGDVAVRTVNRASAGGGRAMPGNVGSHVGLVGGVGDRTIDMVGGNQGRPVQSRNRWSGEWEFRRAQADRAQIDQAQAASTKVEGTGKISVNVNAPKGTNVGAEGGGLFKKVEISRQTQMSEAPRGPKGGYATSEALQ